MLLLDESEAFADKSHSASFSSENDTQGADPAWQCTASPSASPSGGETMPARPPLPSPRPPASLMQQRPSPPSSSLGLTASKKSSSKPSHMRRNIRKLLREQQLEAVTRAAQKEELERRQRLKQQRKHDVTVPLLAEYSTGVTASLTVSAALRQEVPSARQETICLAASSGPSATDDDHETIVSHTRKTDVSDLSLGEKEGVGVRVGGGGGAGGGEYRPRLRKSSGHAPQHAIDALNRPDGRGRVLVNVNHTTADEDIFLSPQMARVVKPHQIGGIRFLYDNLVESLERFGSSLGLGCILAHSMGLGKTLQVISFIDVLFRHTQAHTVLAIVPVNTLQNWLAEFNMWAPPPEALPPDTDPALVTPRSFKVHILNDEHKTTASRARVVEDWARAGGVLLMGYEMYRLLSLKKSVVTGRKRKSKKSRMAAAVIDLDEEDRQQELLKGIERALGQPGPDVVICDEGHRIKNCHASTSQALKNISTRRRVVLTGYPLQNNLVEYWCMVDFVRPDFLGTRQEFSNMFERPILNGQCVDSTSQDVTLMRYRSHVLHSLLEGFVQRRGHDVLKDQLPSKEEHVILVRLSPLQRALYTQFMDRFREAGSTGWLSLNPLKAFCVCCKIWNHPDVLYETLQKENMANDQDLDLDEITSAGPARCQATPNQKAKPLENPSPIGGLSLSQMQEKANQVLTYEWAKDIMYDYKTGVLENSAKMVILFHLIEESVRKGDKMLVFSQSLSTLSIIEEFMAKKTVPPSPNISSQDKHGQNWVRNTNYYRLDGSTAASERERLINQFNDPNNTSAWVFLLSTRAGCLGVNLIGANRVVVVDASWNPCHDAQAVCRVYRYGQKKPCHIYRLVCDFTLERKIYDRQISKQSMSDRVVDDLNPVLNFTRREVESLLHFVEEEEPPSSRVKLQPQDSMELVLRKALHLYPHLITKQPFPHESLLMERRELKLSVAERKDARKGYEEEKRASVPYTRPSYAHYYPASDQSLTNIPAFSQRNWRPPPRSEEKPLQASVRPVQSTPIPMMPRQASAVSTPSNTSSGSESNLGSFPVNYLQKAGVFVQKIVTTTDIVIPATNSSIDVQARISAGESIHVIRGTKGTYIRSSDGRIFAIRAANKAKSAEDISTAAPKDSKDQPEEASTNGSVSCMSPDRKQQVPSKGVTRPLSPDGPDIVSELQRYAVSTESQTAVPSGHQERAEESATNRANDDNNNKALNLSNHPDAALTANAALQPNMDVVDNNAAQDLRTAAKRKAPACSPASMDERSSSKQPAPRKKHTSVPLLSQQHGFPFTGGYGLPPLGLGPAMLGSLGASLGQPLFMGAGSPSPYYQSSHSQMVHPRLMFPDHFGFARANITDAAISTSTSSSSAASSVSTALPPFMLAPPGFPLSYKQSLAGLFPGSMLPGGLPGPAATPGPAGASFLSQYPPPPPPPPLTSSPLSPSAHSDAHRGSVLVVNGRNVSGGTRSVEEEDHHDDDDDDDDIDVMGD